MSRMASLLSMLLLAATARAQTAPNGACVGMMEGTVTLAVADGNGGWHRLAPNDVPHFFGAAECECDTQDMALEIDLTSALPANLAGVAEIWVGDSTCANAVTRTSATQTSCRKIAAPSEQDFTINNSAGPLHYMLSSRSLFSPTGACDYQPLAFNGVWVFVYTDPNNPLASCQLALNESTVAPPPPSAVKAAWNFDGSVSLSWTAPVATPSTSDVAGYDILCTRDDGVAEGSRDTADFSLCTPAGIVRRAREADSGVIVSNGPRPGSDALTPPHPDAVCAHVAATATSAVVSGLPSTSAHRFAVVAVDAYGNSAGSDVTRLAPAPSMPTPAPHGGCSVAGRGSVAPWLVVAFAFIAAALLRRRRA